MTIELRPEMPTDEAFLKHLFAQTRSEELQALSGNPQAAELFLRLQFEAQNRSYTAQYPKADRSLVLVQDKPAGRLFVDRGGDAIVLVDIALLQAHRGRGIGTELVRGLLEEGRQAQRPVRLTVYRTNPAARLYARLGFVRTGGSEMYHVMESR